MSYFSIIIPAYNREREIRRAIQSCLDQDFADFEVLVTDDGSADGTAGVVEEFVRRDSRVRLLRHSQNCGVCAARNTAAAVAQGEWMVQVDSDHSLKPGALSRLAELTRAAPADVGHVATRIAWDTGDITPSPTIPTGPLRYEEWVGWVNGLDCAEAFNAIRRQVWLDGIHWPPGHCTETGFHLDIAKKWRIEIHPDVCSNYHTDASNRCCKPKDVRFAVDNLLISAQDWAHQSDVVMKRHGDVLKRVGRKQYYGVSYTAAINWFLIGHRRKGLQYWFRCASTRPLAPQAWFVGVFGLMGPKVFLKAYCALKYSMPAWRDALRHSLARRRGDANRSVRNDAAASARTA